MGLKTGARFPHPGGPPGSTASESLQQFKDTIVSLDFRFSLKLVEFYKLT